MLRVEQLFGHPRVNDIPAAVKRQLKNLDLTRAKGKRVAVMVGSRGIPNILQIVRAVVVTLLEAGAKPYVVTCMGSHGGATAKGQRSILAQYGMTKHSLGCPIKAAMDVEKIGTFNGLPVYFSKNLLDADWVLPVNRLAAHTLFVGEKIESGLCKMLAIGGGRKVGAEIVHQLAELLSDGSCYALEAAVIGSFREIAANVPILGGLAILDNAKQRTAMIEAVPYESPDQFIEHEARLLKKAVGMLAQFNLGDTLDLVYLERMGKNISGSGVDPNVIGKKIGGWRRDKLPRPGQAEIGWVCCSSLTDESHGNAGAIGLLDGMTKRLLDSVVWEDTQLNAEVSGATDVAQPRAYYDNDRDLLEHGLKIVGTHSKDPTLVCARSTKHLRVLYVSETLLPRVEGNDNFRILSEAQPLEFDEDGHLVLDFEAA